MFLEKYKYYLKCYNLITEATESQTKCARFLYTCKETNQLITKGLMNIKTPSFSNITCYEFVSEETRKKYQKNRISLKKFRNNKQHCNITTHLPEHAIYGYISKKKEYIIQQVINTENNDSLLNIHTKFHSITPTTPINSWSLTNKHNGYNGYNVDQEFLDEIKKEVDFIVNLLNNRIYEDISNFIKSKDYGFNLKYDESYKCLDKSIDTFIGLDTHVLNETDYKIEISNIYPADGKPLPKGSNYYQLVTFK